MKKDLKFLLGMILLVALIGGVPAFLQWRKEREHQALFSRSPAPATRVLRRALASATEVRVHVRMSDSYEPVYYANQAALAAQLSHPTFILKGREMQELIAALHAEQPGGSAWRSYDFKQIPPASVNSSTGLEFYAGDKWIADIRVRDVFGLRWYAPPEYKADAPLLPESRRYLQDIGAYKVESGPPI